MKKEELRIKYKVEDKQDKVLEKAIGKVATEFGFKRWASGFDFKTGFRDILFERSCECSKEDKAVKAAMKELDEFVPNEGG